MKYRKVELARVLKQLEECGIHGVIIGDTSVQLYLNYDLLEGDIDLFTVDFSPLASRDVLEEIARKYDWEIGTSEIGLPSLVIPGEKGYIIVELYENYMDIEIPIELLEDTIEYRVNSAKVRALRPEYYIVLKARQGTDLDKLEKYVIELKRKGLNLKLVEQAISLYPPEERSFIYERLRSVKLSV